MHKTSVLHFICTDMIYIRYIYDIRYQQQVTADWRKSKNFLRVWNSACKPTLVLSAAPFTDWLLSSAAVLTDRKHGVQTLKILPGDQTRSNQISPQFLYSVKPFYLVLWSSHKTWKPSVQETEGEHRKHPLWLETKEDLQNVLFQSRWTRKSCTTNSKKHWWLGTL